MQNSDERHPEHAEVVVQSVRSAFSHLERRAAELQRQYLAAQPVPHIVIDDFLPAAVTDELVVTFPDRQTARWAKMPTSDEAGQHVMHDVRTMPFVHQLVISELNSAHFLQLLEKITGIPSLIADTKLAGGGLHLIETGGRLSVHVDVSQHPANGLNRRLNLLLYLNRNWLPEYGGCFEFWDPEIRNRLVSILPVFNRCVIFSTSPRSHHGHPEPLTCPPTTARRSLALYYFTNGGPPEGDEVHNTLFKSRPQDRFDLESDVVRQLSSGVVRDLIPPVVYKAIRKVWNARISKSGGGA